MENICIINRVDGLSFRSKPDLLQRLRLFKKIYIYIYIRKAELIVKHVGAFDMHFMVLITVLISMKYGMDILYFVCFLPCWSFNNVYFKCFSALHET